MVDKTTGRSQGLLESLTALASTLVAIAYTRLDLLSTEVEEDREHLISLLVLTFFALFSLGIGILLGTILLVALFWENHRLLALASLTGIFLLSGMVAWGCAIHRTKTKPRLFTASLLELIKDRKQLDS